MFCRIPLVAAVSFWFASFSSSKSKLFLFSLLASGFQGVSFLVYRVWLCYVFLLNVFAFGLFSVFFLGVFLTFVLCFLTFMLCFSSVVRFGCEKFVFQFGYAPLLSLAVRRKGNVYVMHAFGCVSICFQFACVLLSNFHALFSNFYVVHGCDFTAFLRLRSLFSNLVLFRCSAWL